MGDQNSNYEVRIAGLEREVRGLQDGLATEQRDRKAAEKELNEQLRQLADLLADNNDVITYGIEYLNHIDAQYYAKELTLQEAIRDFNEFVKLPPKSNQMIAIWDAAWAIAAATVPALRLAPFLAKLEKAAQIEMAASKAFMKTPKLIARVTTATAKGHNIADVVYKANNVRDKVDKATGLHMTMPLDPGKTPVRDLIQESNQAHLALDKALDALNVEFAARLHSTLYKVPYTWKGTLLDMAKRLLPPLPHFFGPDEIEELGRYYLWTILSQFAKQRIAWVEIQSIYGTDHRIDGLNDSQREQIMEWFGPSSNWAAHGVVPLILIQNIGMALVLWSVRKEREQSNIGIFGFG